MHHDNWTAQWIGRADTTLISWVNDTPPAPMLRTEFELPAAVTTARLRICGLGYYELRLNGLKVGDHVLDPIVTQYDQLVRYVTYDVAPFLSSGTNALGVILGNGWYNCQTAVVWNLDKAPWRSYPKLLLQLDLTFSDGRTMRVVSGPDWRVSEGPIRVDALRNGETYDAREERPGWDAPGFDDSAWDPAGVVPPPGGVLEEQTSPPCKVMETITPVSVHEVRPGVAVYDLGVNIAGWARIAVEGAEAGREIVLRYSDELLDSGEVDQSPVGMFVKSGECQTDRYIAKGSGREEWEPRFAYHGFQYVQVENLPGEATLDHLRGRVVHTSFESIGTFASSDPTLERLVAMTRNSYRGNFVGIPTDCPHREKNGWTGDAQLATEAGLFLFDAASSYRQWLDSMGDTQRPSGQFPGIIPTSGFGYNWGSGPAWDSAFLLIPWYIYLHTGDTTAIETHYERMKRYLAFCDGMATDHILSFGLGDWCAPEGIGAAPAALTSTAYYYVDARLLARFAAMTGHQDDAVTYSGLADEIRRAFNARFYQGDGVYSEGEVTSLGCALYQGLVEEGEKAKVVARLVDAVEKSGCRAEFGILGAKYVPRALAENGRADLAVRLFTQPECPGWGYWVNQGSTTLWEHWDGKDSHNHVMFGDVVAWMFHFLAGLAPDPEAPGFRHVHICPRVVPGLEWVRAEVASPFGPLRSSWKREGDRTVAQIELPEGSAGTFYGQDGTPLCLESGAHSLEL